MADITWSDVTDMAPNLAAVALAAQTAILASVNPSVEVDNFDGEEGPDVHLIRVYKAAHMGTLIALAQTGAAGPVTSGRAGKLARSYAAPATGSSEWNQTAWGKLYLQMVKCSGGNRGGFVV